VRRRLSRLLALVLITGVVVALADPAAVATGVVGGIVSRVGGGVTEATSGSGTVGIRESVSGIMLRSLGDRWPLGLGFKDPTSYYVVGLPGGSLEDVDVAGLDSVVTMGALGTVVLFAPLLCAVVLVLARARVAGKYDVLWLGAALWLVTALASALTLGAVESVTGIATASVMLGLLAPRL
jgi:hypothetical protein